MQSLISLIPIVTHLLIYTATSLDPEQDQQNVGHQQLLHTTSPKLSAEFLLYLAGMILIWPYSIIFQKVLVHWICRSHRLKYIFKTKTFTKFLTIWNHKGLSLDIWYVESYNGPLPSLFKLCLWPEIASPGSHMF